MTYFQDNSQLIAKAPLIHSGQVINSRQQITRSLLSIAQVIVGVVLLALSTHLALQSEVYLEVLNQGGLNQYHAFALLVCISFFAGILLIALQVLQHDSGEFADITSY